MSEWCWEVIEGQCAAEGATDISVYGVQVRQDFAVQWVFGDVDTDRRRVEQLAARLQNAQPEPCHWQELVEDWIAEGVTTISCGGR